MSSHALTRAGLAKLLEGGDHRVDAYGAVEDKLSAVHDVVVYDLRMSHSSLTELRALLDAGCRTVVLEWPTELSRAGHVRSMGVLATIGADTSAAELAHVINRAARTSREVGADAYDLYRSEQLELVQSNTEVTTRELQVLSLIALGRSNNEIAAELYLSINSVKSYVRSLYKRIHVARRSEAVVWAVNRGLGPGHFGSTQPRSDDGGPEDA